LHKKIGIGEDNSRSWSTNWRSLDSNTPTHE